MLVKGIPTIRTPAVETVEIVETKGAIALANGSLSKAQGRVEKIFGSVIKGSAQKLVAATKELLKDPTNQAKFDAFEVAYKARFVKLGINTESETAETHANLIKQILAENGKEDPTFADAQQKILVKIVTVAKNRFVNGLSSSTSVDEVKPAIEKKAQELAAFLGDETKAKTVKAAIKFSLFEILGEALKEQSKVTAQPLKERAEAEAKKLADMRANYFNLKSQYTSLVSNYNQVVDQKCKKIEQSESKLEDSVLTLNQDLSSLQKKLGALIQQGEVKEVDCSSQTGLFHVLTGLTQDVTTERSIESMQVVRAGLFELLKFLDEGDGRFSSGPVTKKLPAEKAAVKAAVRTLEASIKQFDEANEVLKADKSDLQQRKDLVVAERASMRGVKKELNSQETLLKDQAALDAYNVAMAKYKEDLAAYDNSLVANMYDDEPEAPVAPKTETGGVISIVEKEAAAVRASAKALYDYLKPTEEVKKRSWTNMLTFGYVG